MRKSMGKYKMTQEMGCFTFETINGLVVSGYMSIVLVAGLHYTLDFCWRWQKVTVYILTKTSFETNYILFFCQGKIPLKHFLCLVMFLWCRQAVQQELFNGSAENQTKIVSSVGQASSLVLILIFFWNRYNCIINHRCTADCSRKTLLSQKAKSSKGYKGIFISTHFKNFQET